MYIEFAEFALRLPYHKALWPNSVTSTHILISNLVVKDTERTGEHIFYILLDIKGFLNTSDNQSVPSLCSVIFST